MNLWGTIVAGTSRVPAGVWMLLAVVNLVATVLTWSGARGGCAGRVSVPLTRSLVAGGAARRRDTALTVASMIPAGLFWAMVLAGSFHGLVSFGRTVLGWHDCPEGPDVVGRRQAMSAESSQLGKEGGVESQATGVRVPSTAPMVLEWARLWVRMCADPATGLGPLNEDDVRAQYGLTAKQLRNVRHAATSGPLRQRAMTLGVELPPSYVDNPAAGRVDGQDMADAAA